MVDQQPEKQQRRGNSYGELLKKATALKRQGDMDRALLQIDKAISLASVDGRERPQAQKKLIYYLLLAKRKEEALKIADQIIAEAPDEAQNHRAFVGFSPPNFFGPNTSLRELFVIPYREKYVTKSKCSFLSLFFARQWTKHLLW